MNTLSVGALVFLLSSLAGCQINQPNREYGGAYTEIRIDEVKAPPLEIEGLSITADDGHVLFNRRAGTIPKESVVWSGGHDSRVQRYIRVVWRKDSGWADVPVGDLRRTDQYYREDTPLAERHLLKWLDGTVAATHTIPIAQLITQEHRQLLRANPNGRVLIKLKIYPNPKMHPTGVAVAWEIESAVSHTTGKPQLKLSGGDF